MNTIREKINQDLKEAMKNGDSFKRDTLRLLNSAFKQVEVDQRITLKDSDIIKILKTAYKQRDDAAMAYKNAGRNDLFEKEIKEMEIITSYLPEQLDDAALKKAIEEIITSLNAGSKDMGRVMQEAKKLNADGKRISSMVKELLQKA
ncbi:GatB/YqeY domain-containing protein [Helicobacter anatolicus]|uniref:GatB/YqeY domain-containing protein n=1 Tax=Helicobacter anatolicus TaxID=2905874 RepID=UPI001E59CB20|nr:GatB/YqeY domain-containing protein [Helicobacter anatolicus]MCE3038128.1 GatB/YqeY domain-containing protein [Helicobacter anatolicus]